MKPNPKNSCAGAFTDWLEVNLIQACNASCSWCIERNGYHPLHKADWLTIANQALSHGATNIILLGGEPTLYPHLQQLIRFLSAANRKVWLTTNGSKLSPSFVCNHLTHLHGINISIHHYDPTANYAITGIKISLESLTQATRQLHQYQTSIRLNCNCILGAIDSRSQILAYIQFAKTIGADSVRFAELKQDENAFVDLAAILDHQFGLNDDPFIHGCNMDATINGMPVNFRQMCGIQTPKRPIPFAPEQITKPVLYYDGEFYKGWQTTFQENSSMTNKDLAKLLEAVADKSISPTEAAILIVEAKFASSPIPVRQPALSPPKENSSSSSAGCQY